MLGCQLVNLLDKVVFHNIEGIFSGHEFMIFLDEIFHLFAHTYIKRLGFDKGCCA